MKRSIAVLSRLSFPNTFKLQFANQLKFSSHFRNLDDSKGLNFEEKSEEVDNFSSLDQDFEAFDDFEYDMEEPKDFESSQPHPGNQSALKSLGSSLFQAPSEK